jgi:hypothetical protein
MATMTAALATGPRESLRRVVSVRGTELAPNLLLLAKIVVLAIVLQPPIPLSSHFLPFVGWFDYLGSPAAFHAALLIIFWTAAAALLLNFRVREACCVLGLTILVSLLASRTMYSNNFLYCGALLLMIGLERPGRTSWLLRLQVVLLYFGAGSNKLLDADWRSGQFFQNWYGHDRGWYLRIAESLPPLALSRALSWATFCTELGIAAALLVRRAWPVVIWIVLAFHTALLVATGSTYHLFFYAATAAMLAFVEWPGTPLQVLYDARSLPVTRLRAWMQRLDLENSFVWRVRPAGDASALRVTAGSTHSTNFTALKMLVLYNPRTYFTLLVMLCAPDVLHVRRWIAVAALLAFSPASNWLGERCFQRWVRSEPGSAALTAAGRVA